MARGKDETELLTKHLPSMVGRQGPDLSVVMGARMAVMAPNLARSVRDGTIGLLMELAPAI